MFTGNMWELFGLILGELVWLMCAGFLYNRLVVHIELKLRVEGVTALLVVGGCLFTVLSSYPLIAWLIANSHTSPGVTALFVIMAELACFGFSGLPMIVGAVRRFFAMRQSLINYQSNKK
jgi:hypothetical protein